MLYNVYQKALPGLAFIALLSYSCANTVPKKTNVLNRRPATNHTVKTSQQKSTSAPKQTVFTKPEQVTKNARNDVDAAPPVVKQAPTKYVPFEDSNADIDPNSLGYRSPQFFSYKADSLQRTYSRRIYSENIQTIINQISETPDSKTNPAVNASKWYAAIDFNIRKPNFVVLHHTAESSAEQTLFTFSLQRPENRKSSAHYVISRDGTVYQMLNDYVRSWHAGASKWGNITDMNSCSLGIEIDNNGTTDTYSDAQINSLIKLLDYLKDKYDIPTANFVAHSDIAPGRKFDPSKYFPWKRLADAGFGYWYNANALKEPPADFNALLALRVIGYDIRDQAKAISAFKLHYIQNDTSPTLSDYDKKVLYNIYLKY